MSEKKFKPRKSYSRAEKRKAMQLYVTGNVTLKEVSQALDIPIDTINSWSAKHNWKVLKRDPLKKLEGMLDITHDRLEEYGSYLEDLMMLWQTAETIGDKEKIVNMHVKLDQSINKWLLLSDTN